MSYFILNQNNKNENGIASPVRTNFRLINENFYQQKFENKPLSKIETKIYLLYDFWEGEAFVKQDTYLWSSGKPRALVLVCSPRFRSVLENLHLPPHRFYPAEVDVLGKTENYFVLHFVYDYLDEMDYRQSQFAQAELLENEPIIHLYERGEIESKDHYNQLNTQLIDSDQWIYARKIVLPKHKNYDIIGIRGSIVLSQNAKNEIEKAHITGVAMPSVTENKYTKGIEIEFADALPQMPKPIKIQNIPNYSVVEIIDK